MHHLHPGGYPPFDSESEPTLLGLIIRGEFSFADPVWRGITGGAKDLICKLLAVDPGNRLTAQEALAHPWMMELDQGGILSGPRLRESPGFTQCHFLA